MRLSIRREPRGHISTFVVVVIVVVIIRARGEDKKKLPASAPACVAPRACCLYPAGNVQEEVDVPPREPGVLARR